MKNGCICKILQNSFDSLIILYLKEIALIILYYKISSLEIYANLYLSDLCIVYVYLYLHGDKQI